MGDTIQLGEVSPSSANIEQKGTLEIDDDDLMSKHSRGSQILIKQPQNQKQGIKMFAKNIDNIRKNNNGAPASKL